MNQEVILYMYLVGCFIAGMLAMFFEYPEIAEEAGEDGVNPFLIYLSLILWSIMSWFAVAATLGRLNNNKGEKK